ncbi:hypothetical protein ACOMHN_029499 [Nucella lapillus]
MQTITPLSSQLPLPLSWRTFVVTISVLHALLFLPSVSSNGASPRSKFKAAVYEHAVILPRDPKAIVTRAEALSLMRQNLDVYAVQAAEAKRQGADILVFPEDGLYGFSFTWESMTPYLEYIPDPAVVDWVPCDDPTRFPHTEVQQTLSCLAKNHSLYLVANMGDNQPCHLHVLPYCNHPLGQGHEPHVQYNTDVAFDPSGKLLARYHKQHLFFEKQFDTPVTPELTTFDTPFGRWGMFTCFDILFYQPAVTLIEKKNIANIAFPTAWMDALPLLASIQFHSAFARGMGVNFLAANIHLPIARFQGSGVYTPKGMVAFEHNSTFSSEPRLIVAEVDVLNQPEPEWVRPTLDESRVTGDDDDESNVRVDDNCQSPSNDGYELSNQHETAFVSELFHDLFNFVQLDQPEQTLHVCHRNICCHLNYSMQQNLQDPELFAFGAFDGLHTYKGKYYMQICALVRCANRSRHSCGSPTKQSSTIFHSLTMHGELQTRYVYPEVLLTTDQQQLRLAEAEEWSFQDGVIRSENGFDHPLLASALFGRWYSRDSDGRSSLSDSVADDGAVVVSCRLVVMAFAMMAGCLFLV